MSRGRDRRRKDRKHDPEAYERAWREDETLTRWAEHVVTDMVPPLKNSAIAISLVPDAEGDVKFWVELGAMICYDKPIIVVAFDGRQIPPKLRLVADEIVELPEGVTPAASEELAAAVERVQALLDEKADD